MIVLSVGLDEVVDELFSYLDTVSVRGDQGRCRPLSVKW